MRRLISRLIENASDTGSPDPKNRNNKRRRGGFRTVKFVAAVAIGTANVALAAPVPVLKVTVAAKLQSVDNGAILPVTTQIRNAGKETQTLRILSCAYYAHWKIDNPSVRVDEIMCTRNPLRNVRLGPGESYKRDLNLRVNLQPDASLHGSITFRLGFIDGAQAAANTTDQTLIWSNAVTVKVVQPKSK
jgi:hypothetical protein